LELVVDEDEGRAEVVKELAATGVVVCEEETMLAGVVLEEETTEEL